MTEDSPAPPDVDPSRPSPARIYDYMLGGTHNFPADRQAVSRVRAQSPDVADAAWVNRGFHRRAARWMAADRGILQFIDIGAGLPVQGSTHGVVQAVAARCRVVYVDNDPMVIACADELRTADETTALVAADLRDPGAVLNDRATRALIDDRAPTGLLMTAVLHFVPDAGDPWGLVTRYTGALAPGSYLAVSHLTYEGLPPRLVRAIEEMYGEASGIRLRSRADIARFFTGLEIVPPYPGAGPDVAHIGLWGAEDPAMADSEGSRWWFGGVARIP